MNSGLDPEALLVSRGHAIPASLFLPAPTRMKHGALNHLSFDNAAAEFRPQHSHRVGRLTARLWSLVRSAHAHLAFAKLMKLVPQDAFFSIAPAAPLKHDQRHLESVSTFGCSPSQMLDNHYAPHVSVPKLSADETPIRTAGFHIHQELPYPTTQAAVAVMDGLLGLQDVLINDWLGFGPESRQRRNLLGYGRAGEYRTRLVDTQQVLEYRTLSPWPFLSPDLTIRVLKLSREICSQVPNTLLDVLGAFPSRSDITSTINYHNPTVAQKLLVECQAAWTKHVGGNSAVWTPPDGPVAQWPTTIRGFGPAVYTRYAKPVERILHCYSYGAHTVAPTTTPPAGGTSNANFAAY